MCHRYHDHALHITLDNAYHGLAGMYVMSDKVKHGGCGAPYNLEVRPLGDAVSRESAWIATLGHPLLRKSEYDVNICIGQPGPVQGHV